MQLSTCHPLDPFPSHTRTERENGKRGSSDFFFWSSHPPFFPHGRRSPQPGHREPPALARSGTDVNSDGQSRYLYLDPTDRCHQRTPGGGIPLEPSHPSCRAPVAGGVASLLPDPISMAPDRKKPSNRGSAGRCLPRQSIQPAEHHPRSGLPLWIEDGGMPVT